MSELKTQGTELFLLDTFSSPTRVIKIAKLTSVDSLGGAASDIDITNFDSTAREYLVGLQDNGTASFGLNLDPAEESHELLFNLAGGARYSWALGCSDDATDATLSGNNFQLAAARSWFTFSASVQEVTRSFATDDAVRVQGGLRVSGAITFIPASA